MYNAAKELIARQVELYFIRLIRIRYKKDIHLFEPHLNEIVKGSDWLEIKRRLDGHLRALRSRLTKGSSNP